jgi:hypothetical protein
MAKNELKDTKIHITRHCLKEKNEEVKARITLRLEKLKTAFFHETNV